MCASFNREVTTHQMRHKRVYAALKGEYISLVFPIVAEKLHSERRALCCTRILVACLSARVDPLEHEVTVANETRVCVCATVCAATLSREDLWHIE